MKNNRNQVGLPINPEIRIPKDDPPRLVDEICEELDCTKVYAAYDRAWRRVRYETMKKSRLLPLPLWDLQQPLCREMI